MLNLIREVYLDTTVHLRTQKQRVKRLKTLNCDLPLMLTGVQTAPN